jgi:hypothetical protein
VVRNVRLSTPGVRYRTVWFGKVEVKVEVEEKK